jgi:alpha-L-rhamnosidase
MKNLRMESIGIAIAVILAGMSCLAGIVTQEDGFQRPPHSARPWVYWINMDGHFTKEGITADLESMKAAGIGGMIHMDVGLGMPANGVRFGKAALLTSGQPVKLDLDKAGYLVTLPDGINWDKLDTVIRLDTK